jgi:hypothetical protein
MTFNPSIDKKAARRKLDRIVSEIQSEKLFLTCGQHAYVAYIRNGIVNPPQPIGCPDCWRAYFFTLHAMTSPELRQEHLDELEEVIHKTVEYERQGKFGDDFQLYEPGDPRFRLEVHKDAADDETGEDKKPIVLTDGDLN